MNNETNMPIADLDVELTAIGGYDSVSGMPCGCLAGIIHPFIYYQPLAEKPKAVASLVAVE